MGGLLWPCIYLAPLRRYGASKIMKWRPWHFGVTWRHRSRDHSTRHMWFPIGGPLWPCVYLAPLRRYKASNLHLPMLKAKSSLRMRRITWPVSRGSKITAYLEFPRPHCLSTVRVYFSLPVSCLWSVLHVYHISVYIIPILSLLQFSFKSSASILWKL